MFIVVEGMDFAGKSSLVRSLKTKLENATGKQVVCLQNPGGDDSFSHALRMLFKSPHVKDPAVDFGLLLTNRLHLATRVKELMSEGKIVIVDRWDLSALVYQDRYETAILKDKFYYYALPLWTKLMEIPKPNFIYFLDPSLEVVVHRAKQRGISATDRYESNEHPDSEGFKNWYLKLSGNYRSCASVLISEEDADNRAKQWTEAKLISKYKCNFNSAYNTVVAENFFHIPIFDTEETVDHLSERILDMWDAPDIEIEEPSAVEQQRFQRVIESYKGIYQHEKNHSGVITA